MDNSRINNMGKVFTPSSVAFVGASNNMGKWGGIILRNMVKGGYEGEVYPVNPGETEVQGMKAYKSIADIPYDVDLAIFTIPAKAIIDSIKACVKKKVPAGVVVTAGFGELGEEGKALQEEMVAVAQKGGMVLVGPNGQGIASPKASLYPWMPILRPPLGYIGLASQSGNVSTVFCEQLMEFGFGVSKAVSAGNCADIGWPDYLEYFRQDPDTKVVLLYLEGLGDGRAFFEAAKKTALEKPVVLVKGGGTEAGVRAVASHTGVLAGSDNVFSAACKQAGVYRAASLEEASIVSAALVNTPLPEGPRVGIVTGGGGFGVMAADSCVKTGLTLPMLSDRTVEKLKEVLPPWWSPGNPVDMVAGLGYGGPREIIPVLMESGEFDAVIMLGVGWIYSMMDPAGANFDFANVNNEGIKKRLDEDVSYCTTLSDYAKRWGKPLLMTSSMARLAVRRGYPGLMCLIDSGNMIYPAIDDAVSALSALADRRDFMRSNGQA